MPLSEKAQKVLRHMQKTYGPKQGKKVFYATAAKQHRMPETWKKAEQTGVLKLSFILPALDLAGLGALAGPTIHEMATGKEMSKPWKHGLELGGLGAIAVGPAAQIINGDDSPPRGR